MKRGRRQGRRARGHEDDDGGGRWEVASAGALIRPTRGCADQAGGRPSARIAEDGGRRPRSAGGGEEDKRGGVGRDG
jgi:hypothetical protein